jgi:hypothetical protein
MPKQRERCLEVSKTLLQAKICNSYYMTRETGAASHSFTSIAYFSIYSSQIRFILRNQ